jgi:hypothetical protein
MPGDIADSPVKKILKFHLGENTTYFILEVEKSTHVSSNHLF